mmetsp:Transcript_99439/g.214526  ORF Transcript_99439/g.214526 Transcript_99439/m.214526 type:complete len:249 (-) Transcript_99439:963-1709(-)
MNDGTYMNSSMVISGGTFLLKKQRLKVFEEMMDSINEIKKFKENNSNTQSYDVLNRQREEISKKINFLDKEIRKTKQLCRNLDFDNKGLIDNKPNIDAQIKLYEGQIQTCENKIKTIVFNIEKNTEELNNPKLGDLSPEEVRELQKHQEESAQLDKQIANLQNKYYQAKSQLENSKTEVDKFQLLIQDLKKNLANLEEGSLNEQLKTFQNEIAQSDDQIARMHSNMQSIEEFLRENTPKLEELGGQVK